MDTDSTHLLHRQIFEFGQRAGEQAHEEGSGAADDVHHGGRQHGDEGVLPGERVEQGHHRMDAAGQGAGGWGWRAERAGRGVGREGGNRVGEPSVTLTLTQHCSTAGAVTARYEQCCGKTWGWPMFSSRLHRGSFCELSTGSGSSCC